MKSFLLLSMIFCFTTNLWANTQEVARDLYAQRAVDVENALKAAQIYAELAKVAPDLMTKADLLYRES